MGLKKDSTFYEDPVMITCKRRYEFRSRAQIFIRLEEDKDIQKRTNTPNSNENPNRKPDFSAQIPYKPKPYSIHDHHRVNAFNNEGDEDEFLMITDNFLTYGCIRPDICNAGSWLESKMAKEMRKIKWLD